MMRLAVFILLFLITCLESNGQDSIDFQMLQPYRFEKERKYTDEDFTVIPLKEDGLALLREKNKYKSGNKTWELILLDTILQEKNNLEIEIDQRKDLIGYEQSPGYIFLLFKLGEGTKLTLELISIQLSNQEINRHEIKPELAIQLTHFCKVGDNFIFGGYVTNEPVILIFNPSAENLKVLPGLFQKQTELVDLRQNQNHTFNIVLIDRGDRSEQKIIFKAFDANGIEILADEIKIEEMYALQTGLSGTLIRDDMNIIGTWSSRGSRQSLGFYSLPINPFSDQKINYTAFGELNHYMDSQNPKRAKKIREKTKEAIKLNRLPDFTNYVMPYRIEEHSQGFIVLAESYLPSNSFGRYQDPYPFGTSFQPSPFFGYSPYPYNRIYNPYYGNNQNTTRTSAEIKASQSVIVAFDGAGKVKWDFSLDLKEIRSYALEQIADFCIYQDIVYFLYKKESELIIKTITLENDEIVNSVEKIKLPNEGEEVRGENKDIGGVRYWYGKNFYTWGQHTIRNKSNRDENSRQVFYINKVVAN